MTAILKTFLRGLVGVAASVLLVALVWTAYIERDTVARVAGNVADIVRGTDAGDAPAPDDAPAADAPSAKPPADAPGENPTATPPAGAGSS